MRREKKWMTLMIAAMTGAVLMAGGCGNQGAAGNAADAAVEGTALEDGAADAGTEEAQEGDTIFKNMKTKDLKGEDVDSSIFAENKLTLVNVWGTWCAPCIAEIPELEQVSRDFEGKGVAIKGLLYEMEAGVNDETKAAAEEIIEKAGAEYQQLTASEEMHESDLLQGLQAFPTTFIVDSEGNIIGQIEGSSDAAGWTEIIEEYLQEVEGE